VGATAARDGSAPPVFHPVPPPRMHLTRYHGVFAIEIETCGRCQGRLRMIASIEEPELIARILAHREPSMDMAEPEHLPMAARAPPRQRLLL